MQEWAGFRGQRRPFLHDHEGVEVRGVQEVAGSKVTAGDRRPYDRPVNTVRLDVPADAVVLVKRRAVDLCRVAACLCPTP